VTIDVDRLKQSIDLVSLVGHYTPLKKRGKEYVGLCVAHADKNPSMWVNEKRNRALLLVRLPRGRDRLYQARRGAGFQGGVRAPGR
jgi:hypothetical protein